MTFTMITLTLNGEEKTLDAPMTIAALIGHLGLAGKRIAVEQNGEIVPRGQHGEVMVGEGDRLEIVVAVGGG